MLLLMIDDRNDDVDDHNDNHNNDKNDEFYDNYDDTEPLGEKDEDQVILYIL